jgi:DNA-binding NarL/FixJ family response regulator
MGLRRVRQAVSVLVADDHPSADCNLADVLTDDDLMQIVGHAGDAREAIQLAEALNPDVVVLGLMDPEHLADATRRIGRIAPDTQVLVLLDEQATSSVRSAAETGPFAYVRTDVSLEALRLLIELAAASSRPAG